MKRPVLAIDFGGSFALGASRANDLDEPAGGGPVASAVFVGPDGRLTPGNPAAQLAEAFPGSVVRDLRQLLVTAESVRVADRDMPAVTLAAAPLRQIALEAARQRGVERFDRVVLTHPAPWGSREAVLLGRAASEAGLPLPWFLTEAEAVVAFHDPLPGGSVAVYDLGGRSLDVTVVRRTGEGVEILGRPVRHEGFGGGDLDEALHRIVAERAEALDAAAWGALTRRRNGSEVVRQQVVEAKHELSGNVTASLRLDGLPEAITVTRTEFEDATDRMLRWTVDELSAAIEGAGLSPDDLAAVYLAGGATRMPRIADLVAERLGRAPTTTADPKAVFALGALRAYGRSAQASSAAPGLPAAPPTPLQQAPAALAPAPPAPARPALPAAGAGPGAGHPARSADRSGPRLRTPHLLALAMIPVTAAVVAGSLLLRSQLNPSENTGASSVTTPAPQVPAAPPETPAPSPAITVIDSPSPPQSSSPPEESPTPEGEPGIPAGTYSVSLSGTVGGRSFQRTARLQVMPTVARVGTTNGVNPVEVCLRSGFPAGTPEVGAIWFGTNTACFPERGAQIDMTTVEISGDTVTVRPDARIAAAGLNQFTASGDYIYSCLYQPVSGSMRVDFSGGSPSGELDINGYSGPCQAVGTNTTYTARFTG
ncbi:Hsp70 family protein [Actinomadura sp. WMMA1423]|uniref:Hsp70 family protein n=1 Tax=Actinomadura sp. WMMA1423 TaxID=2591108 RepID=UPI001146CEBA|nr:Hsp70 family protein [Actinomadura sp. WMMA1423]